MIIGSSSLNNALIWEELENTKGIIRIRKSKGRQHNVQNKKDKRKNNDLQNIIHKTKDRVTRTHLRTRDELRCSGRVSSSCSTSGTFYKSWFIAITLLTAMIIFILYLHYMFCVYMNILCTYLRDRRMFHLYVKFTLLKLKNYFVDGLVPT